MNELILMDDNQVPFTFDDEISATSLSFLNNKNILLLIVPLAFFVLSRQRQYPILKNTTGHSSGLNTLKTVSPAVNPFDLSNLDRITQLLDGVKKAASINEMRKVMSKFGGGSGLLNMDMIRDMVGIIGKNIGPEYRPHFETASNILSVMDKMKDIRKVMDIQRSSSDEAAGENPMQIDKMMEAFKAFLPKDQAKNIESFAKMAQLMRLMSAMDVGSQQSENENENEEDEDA
ncbi:MAG: hypothetical protein ACOYVK_00450 [Bacillota bacterium]